jgi:hypothetical protein
MPKANVLIVDSVDDRITRRRHAVLASCKLLKEITLDYCYAIDLSDSQASALSAGFMPEFQLSEDTLFCRVDSAIRSFKPTCVLVHSGFVYRRYPNVYGRVFARLKRSYPRVSFGIQIRPGLEVDRNVFSMIGDVREIHDLIFVRALGDRS